ncbi:acid protease [Ascoidea rubescens DSM 1968]|uniref:Acid protease n=1 Tax=Ascoidea rubescens DSM 1968 TaxID=1344418 RepID=A0A1D2VA73_9ASCO|nr:acid protease [Ascoidea rubescens DSM 1968]ODV58560.1 acid protease [Ascoidea rubescens DSM 1968]
MLWKSARYYSIILLISLFHFLTVANIYNSTNRKTGAVKFQYRGSQYGNPLTILSLGTPPQNLNFSLNFDSNIVWVISKLNPYCYDNNFETYSYYNNFSYPSGDTIVNYCYNYGVFIEYDSNTFKFANPNDNPILSINSSLNLNSSDLTVASGLWGMDTLHLLDSTSWEDFEFGLALSVNSFVGNLGITSFNITDKTSNWYNKTSLIDLLIQHNLIERKVLTEYFKYDKLNSYNYKGSLLIGGIDPTKFQGNLTTIPMINRYDQNLKPDIQHLDVTLSSFSIKLSTKILQLDYNNSYSESLFNYAISELNTTQVKQIDHIDGDNKSEAIITLTDRLYPISLSHDGSKSYLPPDIYNTFLNMIAPLDIDLRYTHDNYTTTYNILYNLECFFSFNLSGFMVDIPINRIVTNHKNVSYYYDMNDVVHEKKQGIVYYNFDFRKNPHGDFFILGNFFLNEYYAVYDYDRYTISFAPAIYTKPNQFLVDEELDEYIENYQEYLDDGQIDYNEVEIVSKNQKIPRATKAKYYSNSYFEYVTSYINVTTYPATQTYTYHNYTLYSSYTSKMFFKSTPVRTYSHYITTSSGNGPWTKTVTVTINEGSEAVVSFKESISNLGFTKAFTTVSHHNGTNVEFIGNRNHGSRILSMNLQTLYIFAAIFVGFLLIV